MKNPGIMIILLVCCSALMIPKTQAFVSDRGGEWHPYRTSLLQDTYPDINDGEVISAPEGNTLSPLNDYQTYGLGDYLEYYLGYYLIETVEDLQVLQTWIYNSGNKFLLINDIDLSDHPGFYIPTFNGEFDGNGHTISNLYIAGGSTRGLFGELTSARISNLTLANVDVSGSVFVGGLAGRQTSSSIINCHVSGNVARLTSPGGAVGGLVGRSVSSSEVLYCSNAATVSGTGAGGLVGSQTSHSTVNYSYNTGTVTSGSGIVGFQNSNSSVRRSYNAGAIFGSAGIVGTNGLNAGVSYCYNTGPIIGLAGIVGESRGASVSYCYNTGNVTYEGTGNHSVGGVVGDNGSEFYFDGYWEWYYYSDLDRSYNIGEIISTSIRTGGLVGMNETNCTITRSYWDIETSGQTASAGGGFPRTTDEMTSPHADNTYLEWSFTNHWVEDAEYLYNNGYPYLRWQKVIRESPYIPSSPIPAHNAINIPISLNRLSWRYETVHDHADPVGFHVYIDINPYFGSSQSQYVWVPYVEGQTRYSNQGILPELSHNTLYYWKVVPALSSRSRDFTLDDPGQDPEATRGEARNIPVWSFRIEPITSVDPSDSPLISELLGNYPNPFNPTTIIKFSIDRSQPVTLDIFNTRGQLVETLIDRDLEAGEHRIGFDSGDLPAGVYFYRLTTENSQKTGKMLLLK